ncbi:MAG: sorbosone dehydrogenase family protein, partial [Pseudomonadota bacterium]|nr:sorbosone dehydrogenase family protein [Pseudomonadota bacterium]
MKVFLYLAWVLFATQIVANSSDFTVSVLTNDVPNARQMAESDSGLLFVGTRRAGKLYAVVPPTIAGGEPEVVTFAHGLTMPSGIALLNGDLYVGALNRILRFPRIETTFREDPQPQIITEQLPKKRHHGWKYLSVGPDQYLYVPVGAPCNICLSKDERHASILRIDPKTGVSNIYARGIRNSVGMAW